MDEQEKLGNNQFNTLPLTDGWYLRDSKSNPGRKYYFNPMTKQSFWHITDAEIKVLEKKTKDQINSMKSNKPSDLPPHILPPEGGSTSGPKIPNIMHPIIHFNELPYDPSLWAVPSNPEIISTALINNPSNPMLSMPNQLLSMPNPMLSMPNPKAFVVTQSNLQSNIPHDTNKVFNRNRFPCNVGNNSEQPTKPRKTYNQKFPNAQHTVGDLRDELTNRRFHSNNSTSSKVNNTKQSLKNITWDEETVKSVFSFLNRKISPKAKNDCWYIVPDAHVVENHSTLLTMMSNLVLTDTVQRCCLKIPPLVLMELKNIAQKPDNTSIRRFLRFHCNETFSESQSDAEQNESSSIKDTCKKLTEDNYHVVVLCQDKLFKDLRMSLSNPVFTVLKMMQCINKGKYSTRNTKIPQETATSSNVGSDNKNKNEINTTENSSRSTVESQIYNEEPQVSVTKEENNIKSTSNNSSPQKKIHNN